MRSKHKLSELIEIKYGKDHKKLDEGDIPVYGSGGIMRYANDYLYDDESILIPRKGTLNNIFYVTGKFWTVDTIFWSKINKEKVSGKFLFYYINTIDFSSMNVGSAVPSMTSKVLNDLIIDLPTLDTQKKIAYILSTLDDKIELNHKVNQTLEEMAQILFKSWFVDFDPVHARAKATSDAELEASARELGISREVLDLFPSTFVESEMGMVPEGWKLKRLHDTAIYINGASFKGKDFSSDNQGLPIVKIAELKNGLSRKTKYSELSFQEKYKIQNGDILYSWSGSPETSLDVFKWFGGDGWLNQHIFKLEFKTEEEMYHTYFLLKSIKPLLVETAKQKQTTGLGHITVADMKRIKITYPDNIVLSTFSKIVQPIFNKSSLLLQEIITLEKIRDTLLPKLLSGEVEV